MKRLYPLWNQHLIGSTFNILRKSSIRLTISWAIFWTNSKLLLIQKSISILIIKHLLKKWVLTSILALCIKKRSNLNFQNSNLLIMGKNTLFFLIIKLMLSLSNYWHFSQLIIKSTQLSFHPMISPMKLMK